MGEQIGPTLQTIRVAKCEGCILLNRQPVTSGNGKAKITHFYCKHGRFLQDPKYHEKGKFIGEYDIAPSWCPVHFETWG